MISYLILIILWILWCSIHSGLISARATLFLKTRLGKGFRFFRLCYNVLALVSLIPIFIYSQSLRTLVLFSWNGPLFLPWIFLWILTLIILVWGAKAYDLRQFSGITQAFSPGPSSQSQPDSPGLSTQGILGLVRHPWYVAALIFIWIRSREVHLSMVLENIVLTLYLFVGAWLEERKLVTALGDTYRIYQKKVSMFFPVKWMVQRIKNR